MTAKRYDAITKDDIITAANTADIDAALAMLMNKIGIDDGGVASLVFSGFNWDTSYDDERFAQLVKWLEIEKAYDY
jgi:hypothetical protein